MKITVEEKNKCLIATGSYKGKRMKVVARFQPEVEPEDEPEVESEVEDGKEITKAKYKIRYEKARMEWHRGISRKLWHIVSWACIVIADEDRIIEGLKEKIRKMENEL